MIVADQKQERGSFKRQLNVEDGSDHRTVAIATCTQLMKGPHMFALVNVRSNRTLVAATIPSTGPTLSMNGSLIVFKNRPTPFRW